MKLFKVTIDSNPGSWKSGPDPSVLVPANTKEEALQKVKDGWDERYNFEKEGTIITYMKMEKEFPISDRAELRASEIQFEGLDIHIKNPRQAKIERIEKNAKREF